MRVLSAETGDPAPQLYRGLSRRERQGWILGLTPTQAIACVGLAAPVLLAMSLGRWSQAVALAGPCGLGVVLIAVPVRGRSAVRWLVDLVQFHVGVLMRWSMWQSRAAAGSPGPPDEPDLPGVLARIAFPDGPPYADHGRLCLIHDTADARWGATAQLTHAGVGLMSAAECDRLAARLGNMLRAIGQRDVIDRLSLLVRTVPDDGQEYLAWRAAHERTDVPALARQAAAELDHTVGAASVRYEVYVTVSGSESALRRPAEAAGGGVTGRAYALYRALDGLDDALKSLGVRSVRWLTSPGLAEAIRTGFNPAAAAGLTMNRLRAGSAQLPLAAAGPTRAPSPTPRAYYHDGFASVSYALVMPEATVVGSLAPLLSVRLPGERRTLAIHYEIMDQRAAARTVRTERFRSAVVRDLKHERGFAATAVDERQARGARDQEHAVAAGHALVRFAAVAAVTVPADWTLEDHAARLENDAAGRFRLLRLELAQDAAFVTAALPLGIGLPRLRGALD